MNLRQNHTRRCNLNTKHFLISISIVSKLLDIPTIRVKCSIKMLNKTKKNNNKSKASKQCSNPPKKNNKKKQQQQQKPNTPNNKQTKNKTKTPTKLNYSSLKV